MAKLSIARSHQSLKQWHATIDMIKQLHLLCSDIRAHRGASTALLGGDGFFSSIVDKYAKNINLYLLAIQTDRENLVLLQSVQEFEDIHSKWKAIKEHWIRRPQLSNFYEHCELLTAMQNLIWKLALKADSGLISNSDKALISRFVLRYHAESMEAIARLRGYACAFCANELITQQERSLIADEIKDVFHSWQRREESFNTLPYEFYKKVQQLAPQLNLTDDLLNFINLVSPMQREGENAPNGSEVFNQANMILNIMNAQYLEGLDTLKFFMPDDLLDWISMPSKPELLKPSLS